MQRVAYALAQTANVVDAVGVEPTNKGRLNEYVIILARYYGGGKMTQIHSGDVITPECICPGEGLHYVKTGNSGYYSIALDPAISYSAGGVCVTSSLVNRNWQESDYVPTALAVENYVSKCILDNMNRLIDTNWLYNPFENDRSNFYQPYAPTVSANITSSTNGAVVLTASYSTDSEKKEYSEDGGSTWMPYPSSGGLSRTSNGNVYFRGIDSDGNQSPVTQYGVSNISLEAPPMPTIHANKTSPTTDPVIVTAGFWGGGIKSTEYTLDGNTWLSYPRGGITMNSNGTVTFRSVNSAGNVASRSYAVTNIVSSSST